MGVCERLDEVNLTNCFRTRIERIVFDYEFDKFDELFWNKD